MGWRRLPAKKGRRLCKVCGEHPRGFVRQGRWKVDADHDLCVRCYQAVVDKVRSKVK